VAFVSSLGLAVDGLYMSNTDWVILVGVPDTRLSNSSTLSGADRITGLNCDGTQTIDRMMLLMVFRGVNELDSAPYRPG
jgi:hypothetical protein